jgi:hypothetical protein
VNAVFKGEYIKPSEAIKFTTIVFDAGDKNEEFKNLKIAMVPETELLKIQVY